jgi:hypothetical protein
MKREAAGRSGAARGFARERHRMKRENLPIGDLSSILLLQSAENL